LHVTLLQRGLAPAFGFSISSFGTQAKEEGQGRQKRERRKEQVKREQKQAQLSMCCREDGGPQRFGEKETQEIQVKNTSINRRVSPLHSNTPLMLHAEAPFLENNGKTLHLPTKTTLQAENQ
jgi:hypothetical protein